MTTPKKTIDPKLVRELASILNDKSLGEIEVEQGELRIRLSKPLPAPAASAPVQYAAPPPVTQTSTSVPSIAAEPAVTPTSAASAEGTVTAPMVGTVFLAPEPGASAFVSVGSTVEKGATLMLIEAMKTFNPVSAQESGTVKDIIVSDGQAVEFGEPLIVIS